MHAYVAVVAGCLLRALWLEQVLWVGVLAQWRHMLLAVFLTWDIAAVAAGR